MIRLSAITPSGQVHLGNYLGALRTWAREGTQEDVYFISDLHAMTLGPVSGRISVASLATETNLGRGEVERVEVVGSNAPLDFSRDRQGLHVEVPEGASHPFGIALRLRGRGLTDTGGD